MKNEIETARLDLFPCKLTNLIEIHQLWTNDAVKEFLFDNRTIELEESRAFIEASEANFARHGWGIWLIYLKDSQSLIGFAGLLEGEENAPRLLYGLHPDCWRQGFAFEAAAAVMDYARRHLSLAKIISDVDEPNRASVHILEKLGMTQTRREAVGQSVFLFYETLPQFEDLTN